MTEIEDFGKPLTSCKKVKDFKNNRCFIELENEFFRYRLEVTQEIFNNF